MTCPLCTDRAKSEIWRNGNFYLIDAEDPAFPCFLRVVSCRHVPEMSSLTSEERTELWGILNVVEEEIIKALRTHKVNLAQFGNMVPHLHWHVIARWQDDSHFPECPWGPVQWPGPPCPSTGSRWRKNSTSPRCTGTAWMRSATGTMCWNSSVLLLF